MDNPQTSPTSNSDQPNDRGEQSQRQERHGNCARHGNRRKGRRFAGGAFILFVALTAGFAGGFAGRAFGFGGPHGFASGPMDPAMMDQRVERMVKHLAVEVDATPDQRERLTVITKGVAKDLAPVRAQFAEGRRRGIELLSASYVDRAALEALRATQLALAQTVSERVTSALADAADVLSVEQRKTLAERVQRFRGHRGW